MPNVISRAAWNARPPKKGTVSTSWAKRTGFMVHYSGANKLQSVRSIQDYCMDKRGFLDIDYNKLVDYKGLAYEGRGWLVVGSHALNNNTPNIGVCAIGTDADITTEQMDTIRWFYDDAVRLKRLHTGDPHASLAKRFHGMVGNTDCPGDKLRKWVLAGMPDPKPAPAPSAPKPAPQPAAPRFPGTALKRGMRNNQNVRIYQQRLKTRGWKISVDGDFGPDMEHVVRQFQREKGLAATGTVNRTTWGAAWSAKITDS